MSRVVGFRAEDARRVADATVFVERSLRGGAGPGPRGPRAWPFPLILCDGPATAIAAATLSGTDVVPGTGTLRRRVRTTGSGPRYERSTSAADDLAVENPHRQPVPTGARVVWVTPWEGAYLVVDWDCP